MKRKVTNTSFGRYQRSILVYSRWCVLVSVKVTFVGNVGIRFMCVVTLIVYLSKGLQYVLCLGRLMYAVVWEFFLMILSDMSKCTNQCVFLVWVVCKQCVFYLVWNLFDKRIEMHQSWRENYNCMFPKRSSEFVVFFYIFLFLFCDWCILLDRVDNPMRDDLDIVWSEIFWSSSLDKIWPRCFEERVTILFKYVIAG